jgi:hypothetical protein
MRFRHVSLVKASLSVLTWGVVLACANAKEDDEQQIERPGSGGSPLVTEDGRTGGTASTGEGGDANENPLNSECDNSGLSLPEPLELEQDASPLPSGNGGTIVPGTYELTAWIQYENDSEPDPTAASTMSAIMVLGEDGTGARVLVWEEFSDSAQFDWVTAEGYIGFTFSCPAELAGGSQVELYTAANGQLTLYTDNDQAQVFTKR